MSVRKKFLGAAYAKESERGTTKVCVRPLHGFNTRTAAHVN